MNESRKPGVSARQIAEMMFADVEACALAFKTFDERVQFVDEVVNRALKLAEETMRDSFVKNAGAKW